VFQLLKNHSRKPTQDGGAPGGLGALFSRLIPVLSHRASVGGVLEHLGPLPLTAQSSLALVRLQDETLLLGITPQSVTLLTKGHRAEGIGPSVSNLGASSPEEEPPRRRELSVR
jgi:flagellar biogenesis protein FliO